MREEQLSPPSAQSPLLRGHFGVTSTIRMITVVKINLLTLSKYCIVLPTDSQHTVTPKSMDILFCVWNSVGIIYLI